MERTAAQPIVGTSHEVRDQQATIASLLAGASVLVRNRFDGRWVSGYRVAGVESDGYRLSRSRGGEVLPMVFSASEIRAS